MSALELGAVHPTALVDQEAVLGDGVTVGAYTSIAGGVCVGDGSVIGPYCSLGEPTADFYDGGPSATAPLVIGPRARVRSHCVLYQGSTFDEGFECGHHVTIREGARVGRNVRIGTLSDIQGDCEIGNYVRLHSNVHIGMKSKIADYVWIFPYTVLTNDPQPPSEQLVGVTVEEFAVIATMTVILPGVTIGRDALVGASSLVRKDVPAEAVVVGNPAKQVTSVDRILNRETGQPVYPWRNAFDRGMPWAGIGYQRWKEGGEPL